VPHDGLTLMEMSARLGYSLKHYQALEGGTATIGSRTQKLIRMVR